MKLLNNNCYIGCRVSSVKQAQQGESLEEQEKICRFHAQKLNHKVFKVYSEQHSATKIGDSFIDDVLKDVSTHTIRPSWFIIKSIDRFCRAGTVEYFKLKNGLEELGVQLVDVAGIIQPKINTLEHLGVEYKWSKVSPSKGAEIMESHNSEKDVTNLLSRMIGEEISLVRQGYKVRQAEDGFINEKVFVENKKKVIQIPDPKRAEFFIKMFEMRASGSHTDQQIVSYINAMGYRSKTQKRWIVDGNTKKKLKVIGSTGGIELTVKQLQRIIQRPIYCGINTEKWLLERLLEHNIKG